MNKLLLSFVIIGSLMVMIEGIINVGGVYEVRSASKCDFEEGDTYTIIQDGKEIVRGSLKGKVKNDGTYTLESKSQNCEGTFEQKKSKFNDIGSCGKCTYEGRRISGQPDNTDQQTNDNTEQSNDNTDQQSNSDGSSSDNSSDDSSFSGTADFSHSFDGSFSSTFLSSTTIVYSQIFYSFIILLFVF
eukprot:TRINITY_DN1112_c1_g4_i4.p1 TRINITY_DN1112_c1_g4~~TRINITY_DN1112_c1_g4_i4.p1  ORF type:complete len:187 (+),score=64.78 TRINITY_DN1112_c1_g4_i4:112-672(+)